MNSLREYPTHKFYSVDIVFVLKYLLNTYFGTHIRKLDFTFLLHVPTASLNEKAVYLLHLLTTARQTFANKLAKV